VLKDIIFGPMNFGVSEEESTLRAHTLIKLVGLPESVLGKSPFDLSGGQMRRVAIAGVLAMEPEVIVLDEPTAGLDPRGRKEIMDLFYQLHKERHLTTILVTHSMEDAARYADRIAIMHEGHCVLTGTPKEIFSDAGKLAQYRLEVPRVIHFQHLFEQKIGRKMPTLCLTEEQLAKAIAQIIREERDYNG
jgi:energy-coupling factor transport system ATP-binding protein